MGLGERMVRRAGGVSDVRRPDLLSFVVWNGGTVSSSRHGQRPAPVPSASVRFKGTVNSRNRPDLAINIGSTVGSVMIGATRVDGYDVHRTCVTGLFFPHPTCLMATHRRVLLPMADKGS
jgi:hypothetical protein